MADAERRALAASAERAQALFDTMPIGIVYQAADGRITAANPAAERILGLSLDQMQGRTSVDPRWRSLHQDGSDFSGEEHPAMVALRTGERVSGVVMGVSNPATDAQTWIRVDATPLFDPGTTTPREVYCTFLEITAEVMAEAAQRESEVRFHRLFDAMAEGVAYCRMVYDEDGAPDDWVYLSVNPAFGALTGLANVEGRRVTEVIPTIKSETPEVFETYGRVARTGEPAEFDLDFAPLGIFLHIKVYQPEPDHFVAVFENVIERRVAALALRESEARLHLAQEAAEAGTWEWDLQTGANTWSPHLWHLYDYEPFDREASYEAWLQSILPEDRERASAAVNAAAAEGTELNAEWRVNTRDGSTRWLMSRGRPERDESGEVVRYRGIAMDITERKLAEEEVARLKDDLERRVEERTAELAAANTQLQSFVYSISHDLRTPLRTIGSYSQILLAEHAADLDADAADALHRIARANARMVRLVDGLLELSGLAHTSLRAASVDVSRLARDVAEEIREGEPDRVVELSVADGLTAVADEALLRIVFYDLLGNAWKFTAGRDVAHVEVGGRASGDETVFWVRDDGAGYDERFADKLFTPFERLHADAQFSGTGIGLATVKRIVERHGGRVWAEGEVDRGATFYFTLPWGGQGRDSAHEAGCRPAEKTAGA